MGSAHQRRADGQRLSYDARPAARTTPERLCLSHGLHPPFQVCSEREQARGGSVLVRRRDAAADSPRTGGRPPPKARRRHDARRRRRGVDRFWYEGEMRPPTPPELEEDNREMPAEGMMFVGDKGKIMSGFMLAGQRIIPEKKWLGYSGPKPKV